MTTLSFVPRPLRCFINHTAGPVCLTHNLSLVFASAVIIGVWPLQDPWPYISFFMSQTFGFPVNCFWPLPAQSFLVPGLLGPMTIVFCLLALNQSSYNSDCQSGKFLLALVSTFILGFRSSRTRDQYIFCLKIASCGFSIVSCVIIATEKCLPLLCLARTDHFFWLHCSAFQESCHSIFLFCFRVNFIIYSCWVQGKLRLFFSLPLP